MSEMSLYELNKNIMENVPEEAIPTEENLIQVINNYTKQVFSTYYMLLSNELYYYTVFVRTKGKLITLPNLAEEVIACLEDHGRIVAVSEEPGALEFWVQTEKGAECFYFFDYSRGIIYCDEGGSE